MEVTINNEGQFYNVKLAGRVDTTNADKFLADITPLMNLSGAEIIFDCTAMDYTSSQGLRMFLMLQKSVSANGSTLVLKNMNPQVREVFDITGFSNIIKIQ